MPVNFYLSHNSRFILILEGRELTLLREGKEAWRRVLEFDGFNVLGVGNNGFVFIVTDRGVFRYSQNPNDSEIALKPFSGNLLEDESFLLGKIVLHNSGSEICVEKIYSQKKPPKKVFGFFSVSSGEDDILRVHELMTYNVISEKMRIFHRFSIEQGIPDEFSWDISPDFSLLVVGEAKITKGGMETSFSIADMKSQEVIDRFVLEGTARWSVMTGNCGSVLVDSPQKDEIREMVLSDPEGKKIKITAPREHKAIHLGKEYVAFRNQFNKSYIFKDYGDGIISEVDVSAVEQFSGEYGVIFNEEDQINIIVKQGDNLKVVHSGLERFPVDAKRWEMTVEHRKIDEEIAKKREILEYKQKYLKEQKDQMKINNLKKSIQEFRQEKIKGIAFPIDGGVPEPDGLDEERRKKSRAQLDKYKMILKELRDSLENGEITEENFRGMEKVYNMRIKRLNDELEIHESP